MWNQPCCGVTRKRLNQRYLQDVSGLVDLNRESDGNKLVGLCGLDLETCVLGQSCKAWHGRGREDQGPTVPVWSTRAAFSRREIGRKWEIRCYFGW